jgi:hypothetical protein
LALIGGGLAAVTWAAVRDVQARKIQRVVTRASRQERAAEIDTIRQDAESTVTKRNAIHGTR